MGEGNIKNKYSFILAVCFLVASAFLVASKDQNPQWKGTVEEEDGIKVIKNPNEPLYGEITLDLEEDLSIGNEENENYLFYHARQIEVDEHGNIYVIDTRNYRIQVFDSHGKYRMTIGREGQGPGEFQIPVMIRINENTGIIYVQDHAYTIEIFDNKGEHIGELHLKVTPKAFWPYADDNIIAIVSKRKNTLEYTHILCTLDSTGQIIKSYTEAIFVSGKIGKIGLLSTHFDNVLLLSKLDNRTYVYCYSPEYELIVIDIEGKVLLKIRKQESRPKYTNEEKERYEKSGYSEMEIILPENKPYIYSILTDDEGRIYAKRNYTSRNELIDIKYDVFSREGYYLYETSLPRYTYVIREGFLYSRLEEDDEGLECVKRYKIKNWDQIKK
jgi:hypothetical protein